MRVTAPGLPSPARTRAASSGYLWVTSLLGDCVVGARSDRFELVSARSAVLGWFGRSDRGARPVPVLAPRFATVAVYRDRRLSRDVSVVSYHLVPGVQARGVYRSDRPLLVARHRAEVARLNRVVAGELALGRTVYAVGDSNFDGLRVDGLTSAWDGRAGEPGTFGPHRKIDDVHGPGPAVAVTLLLQCLRPQDGAGQAGGPLIPRCLVVESARTQASRWSSRRERRSRGGRVGANADLHTCVRADSAGVRRAFAPTRRGSSVRSRRLGG